MDGHRYIGCIHQHWRILRWYRMVYLIRVITIIDSDGWIKYQSVAPLLVRHYGLAGISEHSSVVEQLAYIQRVGGSVPSVPTRLVPPIFGTILTHTYFHKRLAGTAGRFLLEKKMIYKRCGRCGKRIPSGSRCPCMKQRDKVVLCQDLVQVKMRNFSPF